MLILGDVLAIVAAIAGGGVSAWALIVACGLLFPHRVEAAQTALVASPGKSILRGLLLTATLGTLSIIVMNLPAPLLKVLGVGMLLALFMVAMLGAAGASQVAADAIAEKAGDMPPYATFVRGAAFLVAGTMFPAIGWFLFGPALFFASLGVGWTALVSMRRTSRVSLPVEQLS
ncbi:MAG: hypothetical protein ACOYON_11575 [Fimbriimonas sp.]